MPDRVVFDQSGHRLCLTALGVGGGEGDIYLIDGIPEVCVKVFNVSKLASTPDISKKIRTMIANAPEDPTWKSQHHRSISWPSVAVFDDAKCQRFCGYIMPFLEKSVHHELHHYFDSETRNEQFGEAITWRHLVTASLNLSSATAAIHDKGHRVGDMRETNVLLAPNALITLIDCDSFQIWNSAARSYFPCGVGTPGWVAPEVWGNRFDVDRYFSDLFALGILNFKFLMEGWHPYQSIGPQVENFASEQEKIAAGFFAFSGSLKGVKPPPAAPPYGILSPPIRSLFDRCFVAGNINPKMRPTAREWVNALSTESRSLQQCSSNDNHIYAPHLQRCPWCEHANQIGKDLFPDKFRIGDQVALNEPTGSASLEDKIGYLRSQMTAVLADGFFVPSENQYINDIGLRLQIPKRLIEQVIKEELKRSQATVATGSGGGTPALEVSPQELEVEEVLPDSSMTYSLTISNVGGGILAGTITATKKWIRLSQNAIDPSRHRQPLTIEVNSMGLPEGYADTGRINIKSNGGDATIPVMVKVRVPRDVRDRFNVMTILVGSLIGGVLGCLIYMVFVAIHRAEEAINFLGTIWLFAGIVGAFICGYHRKQYWRALFGIGFGLIGFLGSGIGFVILLGIAKSSTQPGVKFATIMAAIAGAWLAWASVGSGIIRYIHRQRIWAVGAISLSAGVLLYLITPISSRDEFIAGAQSANVVSPTPIPSPSVSARSMPTVLDGTMWNNGCQFHFRASCHYSNSTYECLGDIQLTELSAPNGSPFAALVNKTGIAYFRGNFAQDSRSLTLNTYSVNDTLRGIPSDNYSFDLTISGDGRTFSGTMRTSTRLACTGIVLDALPMRDTSESDQHLNARLSPTNTSGTSVTSNAARTAPVSPSAPMNNQKIPSNSAITLQPPQSGPSSDSIPQPPTMSEEQVAMKAGWDALKQNQLDSALAAFQRAGRINPSAAAADGIAKTIQAIFEAGKKTGASETAGDMYYQGEGVERSYEDARRYYELGGEPRSMSAQRNLGKIYLNGLKVKADRRKGIQLLQKAARQGDAEAKKLLKNEGESW